MQIAVDLIEVCGFDKYVRIGPVVTFFSETGIESI